MKRLKPVHLQTVVSLAALAVALLALRGALREFSYRQVEGYVSSIAGLEFAGALLLSFLSVLATSSLDLIGLRHLGRRVPPASALVSSFVSTSVSNIVSPALLAGGALRYRLYTALGLSAEDIGVLVLFGAAGFWLGFLALAGALFLLAPSPLPPSLGVPLATMRVMGVVFAAAVAAYLGACAKGPRTLRVRGWEAKLPALRIALAQVAVSAVDWTLAAAALWVLAPDLRSVPFPAFLAVYLGAQAVGLASHVPAGLGVFEAVVVRTLAPHAPASQVLGALAAYRAVYYLAPLLASLVALGVVEIRRRLPVLEGVRIEAARWLAPWLPSLYAIGTFVGGVVLLVSGATPAVHGRMAWLRDFVPLPVVEGSHFLGSVVGTALLLVAYGLSQRLDAAYVLSASLLGAGAVFSLAKGLDYEEASLLTLMLVALLPARRHFYRRASLLHARFSPGWLLAVILAVSGSVAIGFFAHRHVEYSNLLWWQFTFSGHAPRFLRASMGAAAVVVAGGLAYLLRPAPPAAGRTSPEDLDAAEAIVARMPETQGWLALLGDKSLLFDPGRTAFLMYGVRRGSWVALGDPIGAEDRRHELRWQFRELVDREGGRAAFYDVGLPSLPSYVDMGLSLLKLGDEARVPLAGFALEGGERKSLRQAVGRIERDGTTFEVLPPRQPPGVLRELRAVSDEWLAHRQTREKGFSLGFFDEPYLARCPLAVARREGHIVAFANVWPGAPGGEISVDLMRHCEDAPSGVMDYLFVNLMLWGREHGYAWFNLGMAPLSGLADHPLAPVWNRIGALLYRHGEDFYNFQGLRQYKAKYDPVWQPRFLACTGGLGVAGLLLDIASLNSRGLTGVVRK
jgi:phosphatidylglycerol lysyltransferase